MLHKYGWALLLCCILSAPAVDVSAADRAGGLWREAWGVVTCADGDWLLISGEPQTDDRYGALGIFIGDADIYDLLTGYPAYPGEIAEGMQVRVAYREPLPGDDYAQAAAIWLNCGEEGAAAFKVVVSENIRCDDDGCTFMTSDGKYRITLTPETLITNPDGGYAEPCDIMPGQSMFVWVEMVTASQPAQAYPEKAVLIHPSYGETAEDGGM